MTNPAGGLNPTFYELDTPSGATHVVVGDGEKDLYQQLAHQYQDQNKFSNVSDLVDLDRLIANEVMIWRWQQWISQEMDHFGNAPDVIELKKNIKEIGGEVRLLKKSMGIDKASRTAAKGESVSDYIENLKLRAKEFGVARNEMAVKAITLFKELDSLVVLLDNTTQDEKQEMNVEEHDILDWFRNVARPEFNAIDEALQKSQKYWIRQL